MTPIRFVVAILALVAVASPARTQPIPTPPNVIVIFCDDLGYGDLGPFGHPTIRTPALDRMVAEGQKWTSFYVPHGVCTPSRAALLTGRYPVRSGMASSRRGVLFPNSGGGLPSAEVTMAEVLSEQGYATACIGKWHLGHLPRHLPMHHGFDEYFGLPYSNDMHVKRRGDPSVPLMRGAKVIEQPADQTQLTKRYTIEAVDFIRRHADEPFFLYLPHTMPHIPLYASEDFRGTSPRGLYGDVIEELDWSVGMILEELRSSGLAERTIVVFTSDNGPWLPKGRNGGSAGLLRGGKGTTWEGGVREPTIFWWPGQIEAGSVVTEIGSTLDLFATMTAIAGVAQPVLTDRVMDSLDLSAALFGEGPSPRTNMFMYRGTSLRAVRFGPMKVHFEISDDLVSRNIRTPERPMVFHLEHDPSERFDLGDDSADVIEEAQRLIAEHGASITPVVNQLEIPLPEQ